MREGVSPSCLALPCLRTAPWRTVLECLVQRLPAVPAHEWRERMASGDVLDELGRPLPPDTPYTRGLRVYYWRTLPQEPVVPFGHRLLHRDEHLVVADKPHFLPVTPGGRYVRETLLVRLRHSLNLPELSPLHRLDRETAGVVAFCVRPQDRDAYQRLFRERRVHKVYEAIAPVRSGLALPCTHRSHLCDDETAFYRMRQATPAEQRPDNSETHIELLRQQGSWGLYRLRPVTGKRHQLRVHMAALGLPLAGDQFYPVVRRAPGEHEDFAQALALLGRELAFTDPLTGQQRVFRSERELDWPTAGAPGVSATPATRE
jgi:tRNA pseudouridine32 synthase/23S rRNA pseudouridine746 synthase